jgi:hypothetical protein
MDRISAITTLGTKLLNECKAYLKARDVHDDILYLKQEDFNKLFADTLGGCATTEQLDILENVLVNTAMSYAWHETNSSVANKDAGKKYDAGKLRWDLLPMEAMQDAVKVLMYGAKKYGPHNWKNVEQGEDRYFAALMRHIVAYREGETIDSESGLSHLSHAMCNLVFLDYLSKHKKPAKDSKSYIDPISGVM